MILMPAMNSALYCCTYYHMYVYIYTLFDTFIVFSQLFMFLDKYVLDIEHT